MVTLWHSVRAQKQLHQSKRGRRKLQNFLVLSCRPDVFLIRAVQSHRQRVVLLARGGGGGVEVEVEVEVGALKALALISTEQPVQADHYEKQEVLHDAW